MNQQKKDYLLLGASGFLGSYTLGVLQSQNKSFMTCRERLSSVQKLKDIIIDNGCKYVICAAGISGRPSSQWCEDHEKETFQVNYLHMLNLMELCDQLGVHLTIYGSGMLYEPSNEQSFFCEEDQPNFTKSVYGRYRVELESHLHLYPNVLCLRIQYPVTADHNPKCFLTKMTERISSVHNVPVAMTIIPYLFPLIPGLIEGKFTGPLNFVNSGVVTLPELLTIFEIEHTVTSSELKLGTSFCTKKLSLSTKKEICSAQDALKNLFSTWKI